MKKLIGILIAIVVLISGTVVIMATEEAKYTLIEKNGAFEIRDYERQLLVETVVDSSLEAAGNQAFSKLFRYISGANLSSNKISMTAPVSQEARGNQISMTAPVSQQSAQGSFAVSFMMPANYTLETLPIPTDPTLMIRDIPARRVAVIRYSGTWSQERYLANKDRLAKWIQSKGLTVTGEPIWARYNPPFIPWFLRRNEVLTPIAKSLKRIP